jgi:hypothetical protein
MQEAKSEREKDEAMEGERLRREGRNDLLSLREGSRRQRTILRRSPQEPRLRGERVADTDGLRDNGIKEGKKEDRQRGRA